jgi:hypothetical protein
MKMKDRNKKIGSLRAIALAGLIFANSLLMYGCKPEGTIKRKLSPLNILFVLLNLELYK